MQFVALSRSNQIEVTALFRAAFTSSEGADEGALIVGLASRLSSVIDDDDVLCFGAYQNESIIGAIFFTRLRFSQRIRVYMLAPVAVGTAHQGKGVGQALIKYGLNALRRQFVSFVVTYGDPSFYGKVGFETLSESVVSAPVELSMPMGWLGQSLTERPIPTIEERPSCVEEFHDPAYW